MNRPLSSFTRTRSLMVAGLCVVLIAATVFAVPRLVDDSSGDDAASESDFESPSADGSDGSTISNPLLTEEKGWRPTNISVDKETFEPDSDSVNQAGEAEMEAAGITVDGEDDSLADVDEVSADPIGEQAAQQLSPFGQAVELSFDGGEPAGPYQVEMEIDEARIGAWGDAMGRLRLVSYSGCTQDGDEMSCDRVEPLESEVDVDAGVVTATITPQPEPEPDDGAEEDSDDDGETLNSFTVPLGGGRFGKFAQVADNGGGGGNVVALTTGAQSPNGNYGATPIESLSTYEVGLQTGSLEASYDVPVPAAAAGPEPSVGFVYSSSSIDGMNSSTNNQAGPIGLGWTLMAGGSINRQTQPCKTSGEDLCLLDEKDERFSITLNGVSSDLIAVSGNEFRVQNDPMWRVFKRDGAAHGYNGGEFWEVVTTDGTIYTFGDNTNSARHIPIHYPADAPCDDENKLCDTATTWDLNTVVDTSGNTTDYEYRQENNYYNAGPTGDKTKRQYVRYSSIKTIEYGGNENGSDPNARVVFNHEQRCGEWGSNDGCDGPENFVDIPVDSWCPTEGSACEANTTPTFWTHLRLSSVQTQLATSDGVWVSDSVHDLVQYFPMSPDDVDKDLAKLALLQIKQRPNGVGDNAYNHYGFSPIEVADYDRLSVGDPKTAAMSGDAGFETAVDELGGGDTLDYGQTWLGDNGQKATSFEIRYATKSSGNVDVIINGETKANLDLPTTGSRTNFKTLTTGIDVPDGAHDLQLRFNGGANSDRATWFKFNTTKTAFNDLPGLPPVIYAGDGSQDQWEWLPNRVNPLPATSSKMLMPRIKTIENELGGKTTITYGQSHACQENFKYTDFFKHELDCYGAFSGDPEDPGPILWHKWKVTETSDDPGADQPAVKQTYDYVTPPGWGYLAVDGGCNQASFFSEFRGHEQVNVTDSAGITEHRFYRGLDGDDTTCIDAKTAKDETVETSNGLSFDDERTLEGQPLETRRLSLEGEPVEREITFYDDAGRDSFTDGDEKGMFITAGTGANAARFTAPWKIQTTTLVGTDKTSEVEYRYDRDGNTLIEYQNGDIDTADDDRRVETTYIKNADKNIISLACRQQVISGRTGGTLHSDTRMGYDADRAQNPDASCTNEITRGLETSSWEYATNDQISQTSTVFNDRAQIVEFTDPNGNTNKTQRDELQGWPIKDTNPLGWETQMVYDELGRETSTTDSNDNTVATTYDNFDRTTTIKLPTNDTDDPSYKFSYQVEERPVKVTTEQLFDATQAETDDRFLKTAEYIDGLGRDIQMQTKAQNTGSRWISTASYDAAGRLEQQSTAFETNEEPGHAYYEPVWDTVPMRNVFTYDVRDEIIRERTIGTAEGYDNTDWDTDYIYDGWTTQVYDNETDLGARVDQQYDGHGNLTATIEYNATGDDADKAYATTTHTYDAADRLTKTVDAQGHETNVGYDLQGRRTILDDPNLGVWETSYDDNSNMVRQKDGRDTWLNFTYDPLDRATKRTHTTPDGTEIAVLAEYNYDNGVGNGRLAVTKSYTPDGLLEVRNTGYDADGQLLEQQTTVPSDFGGTFTQKFSYGQAGQQTTLTYPKNNTGETGETVTTGFDPRTGLATGLNSDAQGEIVHDTTWGPDGQRRHRTYGTDGTAATEKWDIDQRTERITSHTAGVAGQTSNVVNMVYQYSDRGNTTKIIDGVNAGQELCYRYDSLERLTTAYTGTSDCENKTDTVGADPYDETYSYDTIHNLTDKTGEGELTYGENAGPQAVTKTASGNTYGYDPNGNLATRNTDTVNHTFNYDPDNRLANVTGTNTAAEPPAEETPPPTSEPAPQPQVDPVVIDGTAPTITFPEMVLPGYGGEASNVTEPIDAVIPAGTYRVELESIGENHNNPDTETQTKEQWILQGLDANGDVVYETEPTNDLPDDKTRDTTTFENERITNVVALRARHANPDGPVNSITPGNVTLTQISTDETTETPTTTTPSEESTTTTTIPLAPEPTPETDADNGGEVERYLYDADNNRIARIHGDKAEIYIGSTYEWLSEGETRGQTSHYYLGSDRVALSEAGDTKYAFNDHLNSASALASNIDDITIGRYTPWGENRGDPLAGNINYGGQRLSETTELLDYGPRFYDPAIGRFAAPDTVTPDFNNPAALNRYSYVHNNPATFFDPTGNFGISLPSPKKLVKKVGGAVASAAKKTVEVAKKVDVHTVLDVAGMVPVIGEAADLLNAGIYLAEGDYTNAALSMTAMIPVAGNAATAAKMCKKYCDDAVGAASTVAKKQATKNADNAAKAATKQSDKLAKTCNSFVPGTHVLMADGTTKPIEDVQVGDYVQATDPETGETGSRRVTTTITGHGTKTLIDITINNEIITATDEHPFWAVEENEWVSAAGIQEGQSLEGRNRPLEVEASQTLVVADQLVHNFTVEDLHTFYVVVGDEEILTHNTKPIGCNNALRGPDGKFAKNPNSARQTKSTGGSVHGNSKASTRKATLYKVTNRNGDLLKWGISQNYLGRYGKAWLRGRKISPVMSGSRRGMLAAERHLVERVPGSLNREAWAGARKTTSRVIFRGL